MHDNYIISIQKQFRYYKDLGERAIDQLNDEEIHWQANPDSNSIAIIVKHIVGNMLSRWTNFYTEDGEKSWRHRDTEFEDPYANKEKLLQAWQKGWTCLFEIVDALQTEDLERIIYIRNIGHTVVEAINRQLCHYSYHIGQLVYLAKQIKGSTWKNLSMPKNQSEAYNQEKFKIEKHRGHFTDEL